MEHRSRAPLPDQTCHAVLSAGGRGGVTNWDLETAPKSDATGHFNDEAPAGDLKVTCMGDYTEIIVEVVLRHSQEAPGDIGVGFDEQERGRVFGVRPGSPAAKASVVAGDLVIAVDGIPNGSLSSDGIDALISNHAPGTPLKLTVMHGAQARELTLVAVGRGQ